MCVYMRDAWKLYLWVAFPLLLYSDIQEAKTYHAYIPHFLDVLLFMRSEGGISNEFIFV